MPQRIALIAHETTRSTVVKDLHAEVALARPSVLSLRYGLQGDMSRVRVAGTGTVSPGRTDGLWKHTCFEAFIRTGDTHGYYELNFSAAKQWAAYRFSAYREGMTALELASEPEISVSSTPHNLELDVTVALPFELGEQLHPRARLALTAVVEEDSGRLCYWSARHPQGKPDFHHPDGYSIEL